MAAIDGIVLERAGRRVRRARQNRVQAEWLARSAIELAAAKILADPKEYRGENVELIPNSKVIILVEVDPEIGSTDKARNDALSGVLKVQQVRKDYGLSPTCH